MYSMYGSSLPVVFTFTSGVAVTDGDTSDHSGHRYCDTDSRMDN
jgi:hypothetical protein